jgi:hypothetical protein
MCLTSSALHHEDLLGSECIDPCYLDLGGELSASCSGHFTPGERAPGTHWIEDWMGTRAGVDDTEKGKFLTLLGFKLWPLQHPAHSQSLYQLCYPYFLFKFIMTHKHYEMY